VSERLVAAVHSRLEVLAITAHARVLAVLHGVDLRDAMELALVITELGMNAIRHGGGAGLVKVSLSSEGWTVEVEDGGRGFSLPVLADAGRSDRLGPEGVRPPADGGHSFGSGLASVRRLSSRIELSNRPRGGARAVAHKDFSSSSSKGRSA